MGSMSIEMIDFPSLFTEEQLEFIGQNVVDTARKVCGDKLRDVILYGSYARGDFKEWSDVDIMVLADVDDTDCRRMDEQITEEIFDLINRMNLLLSIFVTPYARFENMKPDYPFYRNVDNEGKRLWSMQTA
ncbi:MAG: nucleotidyltransferase domain-containing protein [Clostridiales bacterium]|nr:nucleotidyltransferase domain-containing protein [Clostridiales bacterium]